MSEPAAHERFEQLYTPAIHELAWRHACRLAATRQDAQDLLHDGLATALTHLYQLKDDQAFRSWLLAIIRNKAISLCRRSALRRLMPDELDLTSTNSYGLAERNGHVEMEDSRAVLLDAALNSVGQQQRALLLMHYADDLAAHEIGMILGLSTNAVEQRLFRARQALKRALSSTMQEADQGWAPGGVEQ